MQSSFLHLIRLDMEDIPLGGKKIAIKREKSEEIAMTSFSILITLPHGTV